MGQDPESRKVVTVSANDDDGGVPRATAVIVDASRALWLEDATPALQRVLDRLVSERLVVRASISIDDGAGEAIHVEAPLGTAAAGHTPGRLVSVPVLVDQRAAGTIAANLGANGHGPGYVTAVLKSLAHFIGPAVAAQRARAADRSRLIEENARLRSRLHGRHDLSSIIGNSEAMRQVCEQVVRAARAGTAVLLQGESGTGKEFLARAIHHSSAWAKRQFFEVSCGRLAGLNVEAELLDQLRGRDPGKRRLNLADGGTLFLDDLPDLTPHAQAQLMRVLQQREFGPAGAGGHAPVRVIAASELNLERAVTRGDFRADVYHRVSGFTIVIPPLRDRQADIPLLASYFLEKFSGEHGKEVRRISARALDVLTRYQWPGNVRELANVIERAVLLCDDEVVHGHHLSPAIHAAGATGTAAPFSLEESLDAYEKDLLQDALRTARGVRSRAARLLKTTDRIFNYKVRKHAIDCSQFKS